MRQITKALLDLHISSIFKHIQEKHELLTMEAGSYFPHFHRVQTTLKMFQKKKHDPCG